MSRLPPDIGIPGNRWYRAGRHCRTGGTGRDRRHYPFAPGLRLDLVRLSPGLCRPASWALSAVSCVASSSSIVTLALGGMMMQQADGLQETNRPVMARNDMSRSPVLRVASAMIKGARAEPDCTFRLPHSIQREVSTLAKISGGPLGRLFAVAVSSKRNADRCGRVVRQYAGLYAARGTSKLPLSWFYDSYSHSDGLPGFASAAFLPAASPMRNPLHLLAAAFKACCRAETPPPADPAQVTGGDLIQNPGTTLHNETSTGRPA